MKIELNTENVKVKIENLSETARAYKYILYKVVEGVFWYYGAHNNLTALSDDVCRLAKMGVESRIVESENVE